jgi:small-conductance mechanosensitive channel
MKNWIDIFWNHVPDFLSAIVFLILAWLVIGRLLKMIEFTMVHRTLNSTLRSFVISFVSVALKTVVLITAAGIAGFEVTSLVTLMGAAGLAIGLSLQGELQNFAGGVMILFFKPFEMSDYITVGQHSGKVENIQIFNTQLRTADSHLVIIPNKMLSNEVITNYTKSDTVKVNIDFIKNKENFNLKEIRESCGAIVKNLFQSGLLLNENYDLRITKIDKEEVYLTISMSTRRSHIDETIHAYWNIVLTV